MEIAFGAATTHYDVGQASENTVSAIAWYSDAVYKTEPIISGYRLALSYEVFHVLPTPVPNLRFMLDNLTKLRHLLSYWISESSSHPMPRMLAFILKGNYREDESGVGTLTRNDGRKLQPVTDLLGFKLFFAVLQCHLSGDAADRNEGVFPKSGPMQWSRPFLDGHKPPAMAALRFKRVEVKDFVDLDGDPYADMAGWSLDESEIVLREPLQEYVPDAVEYGGYILNVSSFEAKVYAYYSPTLFRLCRNQASSSFVSDQVFANSGNFNMGLGLSAFQKSILCIIPTRTYLEFLGLVLPRRIPLWEQKFGPSDSKDAILILNSWAWDRLAPFIPSLRIVAMRTRNLVLWGHILDATVSGLGIDRHVLERVAFFGACDVFSFAPTVARLEQSLENQGLSRLILVANIPEYDSADGKTVAEWRFRYTRYIFRSTTELGQKEVAILIEVTKQGDLRFVRDM